MFKVGDHQLLADDFTVLRELQAQLRLNGRDFFGEFKESGNNIQFKCPVHNNGMERNASCGIMTHDRGKAKAGTVHCLTCGYTASLEGMVSYCFGYNDKGDFGKKWLIKNFLSISPSNRPDLEFDLSRNKPKSKNIKYISEEELKTYRYYHPYMWKRGLTKELVEIFDIGFDEFFKLNTGEKEFIVPSITFPVRDETGNTLFIARRSIDGKIFHYPRESEKPVYGLYELLMRLSPRERGKEELVVCESILDSLIFWKHSRPSVALLGTGTQTQYEKLSKLGFRKFVTAFDGDQAGSHATEKFKQTLGKTILTTSYQIPTGHDVNSLTEPQFSALLECF